MDLVCVGEREELRVGEGVIRVHPVAADKAAGGASAYLRGYGSFLARALWRVSALDVRRRFDLVEAHNMPDALTAAALGPRLRGTPVILNVHDTFPELFATKYGRPPGDQLEWLLKREERVSAALASSVVVVTDQARLRLESRGVGVGRTTVVMNFSGRAGLRPPARTGALAGGGPAAGALPRRTGAALWRGERNPRVRASCASACRAWSCGCAARVKIATAWRHWRRRWTPSGST